MFSDLYDFVLKQVLEITLDGMVAKLDKAIAMSDLEHKLSLPTHASMTSSSKWDNPFCKHTKDRE